MDDYEAKQKAANPIAFAKISVEKVRVELQKNPKIRSDCKIAGIGLFIGFFLGRFLANAGGGPPKSTGSVNFDWDKIKNPGWNPVHVFYGKINHLTDEIPEKWYVKNSQKNTQEISKEWFGQHGQDLAVAKFLGMKSNGYFVDLAANDAVWASNTFALEQNLDWKGICIEANPVYWYRLAFRKNCHVVGTIVGGKDFEEIKVNLPTDARAQGPFGGIVGGQFDNKKEPKNAELRYTASLINILKMFDAPTVIDYLSLDVEGAEEFIMKDFPFHKPYTFRVISIERPKELLKKKLEEAGYQHVLDFKRGDTLWAHSWVREEGKRRIENLDKAIKTHILEDWPKR